MNFNKITSDLSFLGSTIREMKINNSIVSLTPSIVKKFGMDIVPTEISINHNTRYGKLLLKIVIQLEENDINVGSIELVTEGVFTAPSSIDEAVFMELLLINGAAALYSIARSKIESISAATFLDGKIIIPMISIYDFYQEKRNEKES